MTGAVFIDKDGTLIEDIPYNVDPALLRLAPGAADGLRLLAADGRPLFVVSNQPGLALGRFTAAALERLTGALKELFRAHGCALSGAYFCPHAPGGGCACRKPAPGLLRRAAREHGLDLAASWMIGDILNDVEAGRRAGCRTVFVDRGHETEWTWSRWRRPDVTVAAFDDAVRAVLAGDRAGGRHAVVV